MFGLMPHPEHAVDPLLGSTDGALILGSLVDAARLSARRCRLGVTSQAERGRERGRLRECRRQPLEIRRAQRDGAAPAAPPVEYAKRTSRSPRSFSSSSTTDEKRLSPARWASTSRSTSVAGPQGVAVFVMPRP